jgi:hypothetical protein
MTGCQRCSDQDKTLALEDRLRLGTLLAIAGEIDAARDQYARCNEILTEKNVRHLPTSVAFDFLYHAPRLGAPSPPQAMLELLFQLLPPRSREQLRASIAPGTGQ